MKNYYYLQYQILILAICFYYIFYSLSLFPYIVDMYSFEFGLNYLQDSEGFFKPYYKFIVNNVFILQTLFLSKIVLCFGILFYPTRKVSLILLLIHNYFFEHLSAIGSVEMKFLNFLILLLIAIPDKKFQIFSSYKHKYWKYPREVHFVAWFVASIAYTMSGYYKWLTPEWQNGTFLVSNFKYNSYRRFNLDSFLDMGFINDILFFSNYLVICSEMFAFLMLFHPATRFLSFILLTSIQLGVLAGINLSQITFGMLIFHIFLFDPKWLRLGKARPIGKPEPQTNLLKKFTKKFKLLF